MSDDNNSFASRTPIGSTNKRYEEIPHKHKRKGKAKRMNTYTPSEAKDMQKNMMNRRRRGR